MTEGNYILSLPMRENDAGAKSIGEYISALLTTLWQEEDGFSGKRPFGNSGWKHEIYDALEADGFSNTVRYKEADRMVLNAVKEALVW